MSERIREDLSDLLTYNQLPLVSRIYRGFLGTTHKLSAIWPIVSFSPRSPSLSVAAGRARPGRGYFLLGLALAGPHIFVRGRPVAWPAVGQVGQAKSGHARYMAGLALAGLWPD